MLAYLFGFIVAIVPLGLFCLRIAEWLEQGNHPSPNRDTPRTVMDRVQREEGAGDGALFV